MTIIDETITFFEQNYAKEKENICFIRLFNNNYQDVDIFIADEIVQIKFYS